MYTLFITNKNYYSWSLRPWVLMRELSIPFTEVLIPAAAKDKTTCAEHDKYWELEKSGYPLPKIE